MALGLALPASTARATSGVPSLRARPLRATRRRCNPPSRAVPRASVETKEAVKALEQEGNDGPETGRDVPKLDGGLPIVGHMFTMASYNGTGETGSGLVEIFSVATREKGPVVQVDILGKPMIFVADPHIVQEFCVQKPAIYNARFAPAGTSYIQNLDMPKDQRSKEYVRGMVFSQGDVHKLHRSVGMKGLNSASVRARMDEVVHERATQLVERWQGADPATLAAGFQAFREAQRFTVDVIGDVAFSHDFRQLVTPFETQASSADFVEQAGNVFVASSLINNDVLGLWRLFDTDMVKLGKENLAKLQEFEDALIDARRAEYENGVEYPDFLGSLLAARDEEGNPLPTRDIRWSVHDMFIAGNDTTASTIAAALAMLAVHPEIQAKLREELDSVLGGRIPRAADLQELPYLEAVIRETLRLYPAAHIFMREVNEDDVLGGYKIPEGAIVMAAPYCMHRDEDLWTEPLKFDPERFMPGGEWGGVGGDVPRGAWLPFGAGARACIGDMLALAEARTAVAALVQEFEIGRAVGGPEETGFKDDGSLVHTYDMTMELPNGPMITATPRPANS